MSSMSLIFFHLSLRVNNGRVPPTVSLSSPLSTRTTILLYFTVISIYNFYDTPYTCKFINFMHLKIFAFQKPCLANFNFSSQIILITLKKVMMRIYSPPKFKISLMKFRFRVKIFSHTINNNEHQFSIVTRGFKYVNFLE